MNNILLIPLLCSSRPQCLIPFNFRVLRNDIQIDGYQLYAVEKWMVDRKRTLPVLTVYTGHPEHTIPVVSLAPESAEEWDKALHYLRRDGARPKQTPHGVIMNTSLAGFRSDFTIVYVPNGDFGAAKDQLYTNINLLRMGCSGRSALTLEEPSDTTKDRFISMYHLPETSVADSLPTLPAPSPSKPKLKAQRTSVNVLDVYNTLNPHHATTSPASPGRSGTAPGTVKTKDKQVFNKTVLELVKIVQAALAIFGMYDARDDGDGRSATPKSNNKHLPLLIDGLLCDVTVEGIQRWTAEIGEPCTGVEPMERVADPSIVSALLSLVLATRNKLAALGCSQVPKDPFLCPRDFLLALGIYVSGSGLGPAASPSSASTLTFHSPSYSQTHFASAHFPVTLPPPRPGHLRSLSTLTLPSAVFGTQGTSTPTLLQSLAHHPDHSSISFLPQSANASKKNLAPSIPVFPTHLSHMILSSITSVYDAKIGSSGGHAINKGKRARSGDGGKVRRAFTSRLGDMGSGGDKDKDEDRDGFSDRDLEARGALSEGEGEKPEVKDRGFAGRAPAHIFSGFGNIGSGIGNLASGIGLGLGLPGSGSAAGGCAALVLEPLSDLSVFVEAIVGSGEREGRIKDRKREKERAKIKKYEKSDDERDRKSSHDSFGDSPRSGVQTRVGRGRHGRLKDKDDGGARGVAGTVRALWSGRVLEVVKLRETEGDSPCSSKTPTECAGALNVSIPKDGPDDKRLGKRRESERGKWPDRWTLGLASDGDVERHAGPVIQRARSGDGHRSTEDESDNIPTARSRERPTSIGSGFSGWSGVRDKLGSWRQLTEHRAKPRKEDAPQFGNGTRSSAEATGQPAPLATGYLTPPHSLHPGPNQSPTLYPFYSGDDDDLLSSGQVSPISDRLDSSPFPRFHASSGAGLTSNGPSAANSTLNLFINPNNSSLIAPPLDKKNSASDNGVVISDYEKKIREFDARAKKRPWGNRLVQNRVISWSDPLTARGIVEPADDEPLVREMSGTESDVEETDAIDGTHDAVEGIIKRKRRLRGNSVDVGPVAITGSADEADDVLEQTPKQRRLRRDIRRRRSFHDLGSLRDMRVLLPEHMKIDVELSSHYLVMSRREEHLSNVIQTLEILSNQLSASNASLRSDYEDHLKFLSDLESHTKILASLESSRAQSSLSTQETNTLCYESEQFQLHDLWRMASVPRRKVLSLREKVFGTGGKRRVKQGVYGAHGKFDRVQWTLDGRERLVDSLGRTESEAEEEMGIEQDKTIGVNHIVVSHEGEPRAQGAREVVEEERDVVEHPTIKPMWLLQFFTNWGARWGAVSSTLPPQTTNPAPLGRDSSKSKESESVDADGKSSSVSPEPSSLLSSPRSSSPL